jgi:hypothetical protein
MTDLPRGTYKCSWEGTNLVNCGLLKIDKKYVSFSNYSCFTNAPSRIVRTQKKDMQSARQGRLLGECKNWVEYLLNVGGGGGGEEIKIEEEV